MSVFKETNTRVVRTHRLVAAFRDTDKRLDNDVAVRKKENSIFCVCIGNVCAVVAPYPTL